MHFPELQIKFGRSKYSYLTTKSAIKDKKWTIEDLIQHIIIVQYIGD